MLSYRDCLDLCGLTEAEVAAIAEHEHLPEIVAVELGEKLLHQPGGIETIERFIEDDIHQALAHGHFAHAVELREVFRHFVQTHPLPS